MASFKPALIVVDFQEDFCPPNGALAVPHGRSIAPTINTLLSLPFTLKVATRDWHPSNHISFATNHSPLGSKQPFTSTCTIHYSSRQNSSPSQSDDHTQNNAYTITLWPEHCIQDTPGASLIPELDTAPIHHIIDKGTSPHREMYSAFYDPFGESDTGLVALLKRHSITHVYVVGLAADFCVKATAEHALEQGWTTYIVHDATKPVFPDQWDHCKKELEDKGIIMVAAAGDEVHRVKAMPSS